MAPTLVACQTKCSIDSRETNYMKPSQMLAAKETPSYFVTSSSDLRSWASVLAHVRGTELQAYFTRLVSGGLTTVTKPQHVDLLKQVKLTGWTVRQLLEAKDSRGALEGVFEALDLAPIAERSVDQLSGGELQRLALALTLVQSADVYLFDEPSSYLDIAQRMRAARAIRAVADQNTFVVVVEHDLAELRCANVLNVRVHGSVIVHIMC